MRNQNPKNVILDLTAKEPLLRYKGEKDKIFPIDGVKKAYQLANELFKNTDSQNKIKLVICDGGHRYYADKAFSALEEMKRKGNVK